MLQFAWLFILLRLNRKEELAHELCVEFHGDAGHRYCGPFADQSALFKHGCDYYKAGLQNFDKSILEHIDEVLQAKKNIILAVARDCLDYNCFDTFNLPFKLELLEVIISPNLARFSIFNRVVWV